MSNKVKYGLKKAYYAVATEGVDGVLTYAAPVALPGAKSITMSPIGESAEFYADDMAYFDDESNEGYEGELELALIPDAFLKSILGETEDTKKVMFEKSSAVKGEFALMYEFTGDAKATRHVFYKCTASRPEISGKSKEKAKEPETEKIKFKARPTVDGTIKGKTTAETDLTAYNAWYTTVYTETTGV